MNHCAKILVLFLASLFISCAGIKKYPNALAYALASKNKAIREVISKPKFYELQIRYTKIDTTNGEQPFVDFDFTPNEELYFYPASTVKLPLVILSLEKLHQLGYSDKTSFQLATDTLVTSFEETAIEIFALSDNQAYNRLYEFLGTDSINRRMHALGISKFRISHRLSTKDAMRLDRTPTILFPGKWNEKTLVPKNDNPPTPIVGLIGLKKGMGYQYEATTLYEPFDFSLKNYYPIESQSEVMKRIFFPTYFPKDSQFLLNKEERDFLIHSMSLVPRKAGYDPKMYPDSYGKFFLFGDRKRRIPEQIKIYNKVGYAYGTLTDCAYIKNPHKKIQFFLVATLLVNKNGIFNDDHYEYQSLGIPFLAALGREIYRYEKKTK